MKFYKTRPYIEFIKETENGDIVRLKRNMVYFIGDKSIVVPKGFESDGASVPRLLWRSISPTIHPSTIAAAILHDWLYRKHLFGWNRYVADACFYSISRSDGLSWWRAALAWLGLRLFGWIAWRKGGGQ